MKLRYEALRLLLAGVALVLTIMLLNPLGGNHLPAKATVIPNKTRTFSNVNHKNRHWTIAAHLR